MNDNFTSNYSGPKLSPVALNNDIINNPQNQIDQLNQNIRNNQNVTVEEYIEKMGEVAKGPRPYIDDTNYGKANLGPGFFHTTLDSRNKIIEEQQKAFQEKIKGYSASDWEAAMKDPSQLNLNTKEEVLDKYISTHSDKIKETKSILEESATKKKPKKNLTQSYEESKNSSTSSKLSKKERKELEENLRRQEAKLEGLEYRKKRRSNKTLAEEEIAKLKDLKKNLPIDDNYMDSIADIEKQIDGVSQKLSTQQKVLKSQSKATIQGKLKGELSPFKVMNTAFALTQAVGSYKESRAEGHGVVNSAIKGVGDLMLTEALGPIGYGAYQLAKVAPKAAIKGTNMLYQENRRMNSASNFVPLGGVNFQDTQDLATMRQSGMELAKMSQYNLEQTLMGAEAKHLHR